MGKLLKYEFKKASSYFLYLIVGGFIASCLLILGIKSFTGDNLEPGLNTVNDNGLIFPITMIVSIIIATAIVICFIFYVVSNYKRDLYNNQSLLKFTLPIDGKDFLNSKLINIIIWTIILNVTITAGFYFFSKFLIPNIHDAVAKSISMAMTANEINISHVIFVLVARFVEGIFSFVLLYFSITFTKAVFKESNSGILWLLVYLAFSIAHSIAAYFINLMVPYRVEFFKRIELVYKSFDMFAQDSPQSVLLSFNLASAILFTVLCIVYYFLTRYMLDNKVDL